MECISCENLVIFREHLPKVAYLAEQLDQYRSNAPDGYWTAHLDTALNTLTQLIIDELPADQRVRAITHPSPETQTLVKAVFKRSIAQ